jgi:hypothetical protein
MVHVIKQMVPNKTVQLQNSSVHNGTHCGFITEHYTTVCSTIFKHCNSQKSIKLIDTEEKSTNPWICWIFGLA